MATLNQWAAEGRLIPDTILVDAATGAELPARDVPGLFFPIGLGTAAAPPPGPSVGTPLGGYQSPPAPTGLYGSNYPRQTPLYGSGRLPQPPNVTASYVVSVVGIGLLCCVPMLSALAGLIAVGLAASANRVDPSRAKGAIVLGVVVALFGIGLSVGFAFLSRGFTPGGG